MRGGRGGLRDIEEINDTALSFAEVKALATGNPLILEKAEVDTEIARFTQLRAAHERDRLRLGRLEGELLNRAATLEDRAGRLDRTVDAATDTRGDAFTMTVGRRALRDRSEAGRRLRERLLPAATGRLSRSEPLGALGGFPLELRNGAPGEALVVITAPAPFTVAYTARELGDTDPRQLVQRLERTLLRAGTLAADARRDAADLRDEAVRARTQAATPFEHIDRLAQLRTRQQLIDQQLMPEPPAAAAPELST